MVEVFIISEISGFTSSVCDVSSSLSSSPGGLKSAGGVAGVLEGGKVPSGWGSCRGGREGRGEGKMKEREAGGCSNKLVEVTLFSKDPDLDPLQYSSTSVIEDSDYTQ